MYEITRTYVSYEIIKIASQLCSPPAPLRDCGKPPAALLDHLPCFRDSDRNVYVRGRNMRRPSGVLACNPAMGLLVGQVASADLKHDKGCQFCHFKHR